MQAQGANRSRHHARVLFSPGNFLVCVPNAQPSPEVEVLQRNSRAAQLVDIARQMSQRPLKRTERNNLRADVHADSPPLHISRIAMRQVQASRLLRSEEHTSELQ